MLYMLAALLIFLDALAPLLPIWYLLKYRSSGKTKGLLALLLFLLLQFVFNLLANVLSYFPFPNYFVYHISLPLSFVALLFFFKSTAKAIFFTHAYFIAGFVLTALFIASSLWYETINIYNSSSHVLGSLYVLVICLNYYWEKIHTDDGADILRQPPFWFISGFFIYFCTCFIIFFSYKSFIIKQTEFAWVVWRFHNIMYLIMCILLSKGIKEMAYE